MKAKFFRKVLKNGMTVILEKRDLPIVSVAFAVRNGGVNEINNEKGISHFIEHMLYKGTPTRDAKKIAEEIERKGGELNGFTGEEITAYWCKMPSKHLGVALDVLSDMVKNPKFDEKELEKERKVIFEEIKMRKDTPRVFVFDEIQSCLYNKPFGDSLIGSEKTMNSINRDKLFRKFKKIYNPNNLILCVVGNANFEELVKFAEKNFREGGQKALRVKIKKENKVKIEKRKGINQVNFVFAYHVPLAKDKKSYAARILSSLMAGGMSSRLFSEIREKRNLAYDVKGTANINGSFAYNLVYVGTTKEKVKLAKDLILKEFEKVENSLGEREFREVKEQLIGNYEISMEDSQEQMMNLLDYEICGDAKGFYDFIKEIKNVKIEDVKKLAREARKKNSFFALVPEG